MKHLTLAFLIFCLASCASRPREMHEREHEQTHVSSTLDSARTAAERRDSVVLRDSVFIYQRGDTVFKYVERSRTKVRVKTDTVTRLVTRVDTVTIADTHTVAVTKEVAKPMPRYLKCLCWIGGLCLAGAILWSAIFIKRKF